MLTQMPKSSSTARAFPWRALSIYVRASRGLRVLARIGSARNAAARPPSRKKQPDRRSRCSFRLAGLRAPTPSEPICSRTSRPASRRPAILLPSKPASWPPRRRRRARPPTRWRRRPGRQPGRRRATWRVGREERDHAPPTPFPRPSVCRVRDGPTPYEATQDHQRSCSGSSLVSRVAPGALVVALHRAL